METDSFNGCDQVVVLPTRGKFGRDAATKHDQHAVTGTQVIEFAGDHEHRFALFTHTAHSVLFCPNAFFFAGEARPNLPSRRVIVIEAFSATDCVSTRPS